MHTNSLQMAINNVYCLVRRHRHKIMVRELKLELSIGLASLATSNHDTHGDDETEGDREANSHRSCMDLSESRLDHVLFRHGPEVVATIPERRCCEVQMPTHLSEV